MLESFKGKQFTYTPLTKEEMAKRGILGRLVGPIADTKEPTRNGRLYSKELWENVFNDPLMQEKIKNRCLFQELGHPEDRTEVDMEKICSCLAETPKIGEDGLLYGVFDILPTKNGQLLKVLCDYGTTIGISSRGTGDVIDDGNGNETVDPSTYDCETFDWVIVPAVEKARMNYVNESLDKDNVLNLKRALVEELNKASPEDKKVMEETLQTLGLSLEEPKEDSNPINGDENKSTESENPKQTLEEAKEASNDGSDALIKSFQEALMKSAELEQKVKALQEQLAVSDAEVNKLKEDGERHKSIIVNLTRQVKESKKSNGKASTLEEELKAKERKIESLEEENQRLRESKISTRQLRESISNRQGEIKRLQESIKEKEASISKANEELLRERQNSSNKMNELTEEVSKSRRIAEGYKRLANDSVNKYIGLKAVMLGIEPQVIKNNLKEQYTLKDVDEACEKLQGQEINLRRLPFTVGKNGVVKVNESKQLVNPKPSKADIYDDDYVDENLLKVAGVIK